MKEREPGTVRESRIPIYDHKGQMRGHVGPNATSVTVARFINLQGAKLGKKDGRQAWLGPKPPLPKPPKMPAQAKPAAGPTGQGATSTIKISLSADKGSVGKGDMKRRS